MKKERRVTNKLVQKLPEELYEPREIETKKNVINSCLLRITRALNRRVEPKLMTKLALLVTTLHILLDSLQE